MDPFGMSPEQYVAAGTWVMAVAAVLTLMVLTVAAKYAKGQFDEARELRLQQSRPYVVASVGIEQQFMFMFVVENTGNVAAHNVCVEFDTPPQSTLRDIDELRILREGIPTMPPRHRYRTFWESALTVFDDKDPYSHPKSYVVSVSYEDHHGRQFGPEPYILDFRVFEGQAAGPKGLTELVKAVEQIGSQQKGWMERGLLVRARNGDAEERRLHRPFRIRRALRAKDDDGWRGLLDWYIADVRRRTGLYEKPGRPKKANGM